MGGCCSKQPQYRVAHDPVDVTDPVHLDRTSVPRLDSQLESSPLDTFHSTAPLDGATIACDDLIDPVKRNLDSVNRSSRDGSDGGSTQRTSRAHDLYCSPDRPPLLSSCPGGILPPNRSGLSPPAQDEMMRVQSGAATSAGLGIVADDSHDDLHTPKSSAVEQSEVGTDGSLTPQVLAYRDDGSESFLETNSDQFFSPLEMVDESMPSSNMGSPTRYALFTPRLATAASTTAVPGALPLPVASAHHTSLLGIRNYAQTTTRHVSPFTRGDSNSSTLITVTTVRNNLTLPTMHSRLQSSPLQFQHAADVSSSTLGGYAPSELLYSCRSTVLSGSASPRAVLNTPTRGRRGQMQAPSTSRTTLHGTPSYYLPFYSCRSEVASHVATPTGRAAFSSPYRSRRMHLSSRQSLLPRTASLRGPGETIPPGKGFSNLRPPIDVADLRAMHVIAATPSCLSSPEADSTRLRSFPPTPSEVPSAPSLPQGGLQHDHAEAVAAPPSSPEAPLHVVPNVDAEECGGSSLASSSRSRPGSQSSQLIRKGSSSGMISKYTPTNKVKAITKKRTKKALSSSTHSLTSGLRIDGHARMLDLNGASSVNESALFLSNAPTTGCPPAREVVATPMATPPRYAPAYSYTGSSTTTTSGDVADDDEGQEVRNTP